MLQKSSIPRYQRTLPQDPNKRCSALQAMCNGLAKRSNEMYPEGPTPVGLATEGHHPSSLNCAKVLASNYPATKYG